MLAKVQTAGRWLCLEEAMELTDGRAQWLLCSSAELHFSTQTNNVTAPVRTNSSELRESSGA